MNSTIWPSPELLHQWKVRQTADFVTAGEHRRVALQFPDSLLAEAPNVAAAVAGLCPGGTKVAILADSAFNPESVDEVAAAHMSASCIVHYGRTSLTPSVSTPVLHVFPEGPLDVTACASSVVQGCQHEVQEGRSIHSLVIFVDQSLLQHAPVLRHVLQGSHEQGWHIDVAQPLTGEGVQTTAHLPSAAHNSEGAHTRCEAVGYTWLQALASQPPVCCWVGPEHCSLLQALQMSLSTCHWVRIHVDLPTGNVLQPVQYGLTNGCSQLVKRRRFLVEKARSAALLGILVGTGGSPDVNRATAHLRSLIRAAGKHSYTVVIGKPSPHKLANFPEVEVWVQLSDPLGAILDSREYLAPLVTPQEAVLALTGGMLTADTRLVLGLQPLLNTQAPQPGSTLSQEGEHLSVATLDTRTLMPGADKQLGKAQRGVEYLRMRAWKGVDAPVAGAESKAPAAAVEGLVGRAAGYVNEASDM